MESSLYENLVVPLIFNRLPIHLFPQLPRAPERDPLSWLQHQVLSSGRVPASPLPFFFDTELSEVGDQYVFAGFQGAFDEFEQYLDGLESFLMGVPVGIYDGLDDAGFGECTCFWHLGLLSPGRLHVTGKGLICQGK